MDYEVGPWKMAFFNGPNSWSNFHVRLLKILVLKASGPSLGVNQMWTKKNDHTPKNKCADFLNECPKRAFSKQKIKIKKIVHSLVFS